MASNEERPPEFFDGRLISALSHDTREFALAVCSIRPTSTKEVADALEISVNAAWYHVNKLEQMGCLKEVSRKKGRGAEERFYIATSGHYFDSDTWEQVLPERRMGFMMRILRLVFGDIDKAIRAGTIVAADSHISRIPMNLDGQGRVEAYAVLKEAMEDLLAVRKRCAARTRGGEVETIPASFILMQLELAPREER